MPEQNEKMILVVDHDPEFRQQVLNQLFSAGFSDDVELLEAENTDQALQIMSDIQYQVIAVITDIGRSGNGREVIQAAQKLLPKPVTAITSCVLTPAVKHAGADVVVHKKYLEEDLFRFILKIKQRLASTDQAS